MTGSRRVRVCRVDALTEGEGTRIETTPPIAVFLTDGELLCVDDTCTHDAYALSDGLVERCTVECPLHLATFDLRTGAVLSPPASRPLRAHTVVVEDGDVDVWLPATYELPTHRRDGIEPRA